MSDRYRNRWPVRRSRRPYAPEYGSALTTIPDTASPARVAAPVRDRNARGYGYTRYRRRVRLRARARTGMRMRARSLRARWLSRMRRVTRASTARARLSSSDMRPSDPECRVVDMRLRDAVRARRFGIAVVGRYVARQKTVIYGSRIVTSAGSDNAYGCADSDAGLIIQSCARSSEAPDSLLLGSDRCATDARYACDSRIQIIQI